MHSSGRNNPCPVCGRTKDSDCRWNNATILCHTGTDLRPGDTLTYARQKWAFIHHKGGFSGMAAVFKPHRALERGTHKTRNPNAAQELLSRQNEHHQWSEVLNQFFAAFDAAWNIPDLDTATPQQLAAAFAAINDAQTKAAALAPHLQSIWSACPDLQQLHRLRVEHYLKTIAHIAEDARRFKEQDLGTHCTAAVHELLGEEL